MEKIVISVYLSGPISGVEDYKEKFEEAQKAIEAINDDRYTHVVLNPAMLPDGLSKKEYMQIDLQMLSNADVMVMLPGWEASNGARIEKLYAQYIGGISIFGFEEFIKGWRDKR